MVVEVQVGEQVYMCGVGRFEVIGFVRRKTFAHLVVWEVASGGRYFRSLQKRWLSEVRGANQRMIGHLGRRKPSLLSTSDRFQARFSEVMVLGS